MTLTPASFAARGSADEQQSFTANVSFDADEVDEPLFGSIVATFVPDATAGGDVALRVAVQMQVLAAPSADALDDLPRSGLALTMGRLTVRQQHPWTPIDAAFPNLPFLVDHGPVVVESQGMNVGDVPLDARTTFEFRRLNVLDLLPGRGTDREPVLTIHRPPKFVLPEQTITDSTSSVARTEGGMSADALPLIGFVRVTARVEGELSGVEARPAALTRTVLVFPWSEATFLFVVWLFQREWRHRKGRKPRLGADGQPVVSSRARIRERLGSVLGWITRR